mmetsp:Transcript_18857/g.43850  ORF Transcript_18857/g.43850 Transcript_18857/m.43850 type:complete len:244 (-) Transcript_18857:223-954(-)
MDLFASVISLSPESHTPESRRGCTSMIVMRIFHLQTPQATESPLHNHQSLVLVGRHSLLVLIEYPCHFFQIFSVPFVDIFLRRLGNMRDTNRLAGHIEQLFISWNGKSPFPPKECERDLEFSREICQEGGWEDAQNTCIAEKVDGDNIDSLYESQLDESLSIGKKQSFFLGGRQKEFGHATNIQDDTGGNARWVRMKMPFQGFLGGIHQSEYSHEVLQEGCHQNSRCHSCLEFAPKNIRSPCR